MANNAPRWTKEDVQRSKQSLDDADYELDTGRYGNPNAAPKEKSLELFNNIHKFWKKYGDEFSKFWRELPRKEKINFIKVVSPYLPKNKKDPNANELMIDFTVDSLMENNGERFLELFNERASSHNWIYKDFEFCEVNVCLCLSLFDIGRM